MKGVGSERRILVTGASGFIGSHLVRRLLADGHSVVGVCSPFSRRERLLGMPASLTVHAADLCAPREVDELFAEGTFDAVFHLAARGVDSRDDDAATLAVNSLGTLNLARAAMRRRVSRFVHCGSGLEYRPSRYPTPESAPLSPPNLYGATKASGWLQLDCLCRSEGLPVVTVRPFAVYGPGESDRKLIPHVILRGLSGAPIPLTSGEQIRDFVYVTDVVEALVLAGEKPSAAGAIYNIGAGREGAIPVRALAEAALDIIGVPRSLARFGELRHGRVDPPYLVADNTLARKVLGWRPQVPLETGLRRTIASVAPLARLELVAAAGGGR